jgi:phospholipase/carboxylesterase
LSQTDTLDFVQAGPPRGEARACVIWLHGLGADGHDFESIVPELGLAQELGVRFVFPHAPSIPVTLNGGMVMPAWYDIEEVDLRRRHDEAGIRRSAQQLSALIDAERAAGVPDDKMVLAGFSQGGAIALFAGLRHPRKLAGILAMSTYLVVEEATEAERSEANRATPILQAHGDFDPMVPVARGADARDRLIALGYSVDWHTYPMQHQVCLEEIQLVGSWLAGVLS